MLHGGSENNTQVKQISVGKYKVVKVMLYIFAVLAALATLAAIHFALNFDISFTTTEQLQKQIDELRPLKERENRIKDMERTLMVHYKLSWYEAHYYSIIFDDMVQEYDSLFDSHGIDWHIFPAVMRIESNFDPRVVSKKGAKGLMQVLEKTAKEMTQVINEKNMVIHPERHPIEYKRSKTLFIEVLNIIIGCEYLCQQIEHAADLEAGIKAYLGGPGFDKGRKDIGKYRTTVRWEYERLRYIHKGVMNDPGLPEPDLFVKDTDG